MQYRALGRTGVQVSALTLGTMNFGEYGNTTQDDATALVRRAVDAGINLVDCADVYSRGHAEEMLGTALKEVDRDDIVLATKFRLPMGDQNARGGSRRWIIRAVEDSLRRLGTDHIDLYQMHRPDPTADIEETLAALTDLQRAGKILYIGSSTFSAAQVVEAQWAAERRSLTRFVTEQPPYSILMRDIEADLLPTTQRHGMGVLTWGPLASGYLSGRYRPGADPEPSHRETHRKQAPPSPADDLKRAAAEKLYTLAQDSGLSLVHMALAFVMNHPGVTSAILGPRTMDQLETQLGAVDVTLTDDVLDAIDEIVPPGISVNPGDSFAVLPSLSRSQRRR